MRSWALVAMASAAACTRARPPDADGAHPALGASVAPQPDAAPSAATGPTARDRCAGEAFRCAHDEDCVSSCLHGAVSRAWWERAYPGGEACEDGCAAKGTDPPRCVAGACAAFRAGAPDPLCTCRDAPVATGPGPAHRCGADGDCMMSCEFGALRRDWFESQGLLRFECKDGCAEIGEARCRSGACVAERAGQPVEACTRRPAHPRRDPPR